ncbi:hypothetical protein BGZ94_010292, partial [Podila epigama]
RKTTIHELKQLIVTRLDTHPTIVTPVDQRLIFGGRILEDKDTLDHIFDKVEGNDAPTIHLMVTHRYLPGSSEPASPAPIRFRHVSSESTASTPSPVPLASFTPQPSRAEHTPAVAGSSKEESPTVGATTSTNLNTQSFTTMSSDGPSGPHNAYLGHQHHTHHLVYPFHQQYYQTMAATAGPIVHQPYQYAIINGMPYLVPATTMALLNYQQMWILQPQLHFSPYRPFIAAGQDNTPLYHIPPTYLDPTTAAAAASGTPGHTASAGAAPAAAAQAMPPPLNAQEIAARDQRRAASLWLIMKLAFAVYLFSQNGSIERIVLLHIAALIIFLHQTGRLRIVRRIVPQPGEAPRDGAPGAGANDNNNINNNNTHQQYANTNGQRMSDAPGSTSDAQAPTSSFNGNMKTVASSSSSSSGLQGSELNGEKMGEQQQSSSSVTGALNREDGTAFQDTQEGSHPSLLSNGQGPVSGETQQQDQPQQQQARASPWRNIEHALLTFVTSLVPAPPPEIDPAVAAAAGAGERGM